MAKTKQTASKSTGSADSVRRELKVKTEENPASSPAPEAGGGSVAAPAGLDGPDEKVITYVRLSLRMLILNLLQSSSRG